MNKPIELSLEETKAIIGGTKMSAPPVVTGANAPPVVVGSLPRIPA
jgi:hypothetical protein